MRYGCSLDALIPLAYCMPFLDRNAWLARLGNGSLRIAFLTAGHAQFDAAWGHRNRTLPGIHLLYGVTGGRMRVRAGSIDREVRAGSMAWISAGVPHTLALERPGESMAAFHARLSVLDHQRRPQRLADDCLIASFAAGSGNPVAEAFAEHRRPGPWAGERLAARWVLVFGNAFVGAERPASALSMEQEAALRRMLDAEPASRRTAPADLARAAGLSPRYFARRFNATFAQTPRTWLVSERMRRAALLLLERDVPIGVIAKDLGYEDMFLFSRQFRQVVGRSPSEFRRDHRR